MIEPTTTADSPPQTAPAQAPPATSSAVADPRRKSPFLACALSLMPGLGQVYVGYYQRGFLNAAIAASTLTLLVAEVLGPLIPLASLLLLFFWLYNIIDAGRRAALYNEALAGRAHLELPADFKTPGLAGSIPAGVVLVLLGLTLLSNTAFGVSLDWLEDWWPLALIGFGGYLIYKARDDRSPTRSALED